MAAILADATNAGAERMAESSRGRHDPPDDADGRSASMRSETYATATAVLVDAQQAFVHEGERRHEILFIFDLAFPEGAFEGQKRIRFQEDDGTLLVAAWYDPQELDVDGKPELYPKGHKSHLISR